MNLQWLGKYQDWLTDEGLLQLEAWARDGLTDEQIASNMGIDTRTLYRWKKKHPDISYTLKKGKAVVDIPAMDLGVFRTYRINDTGNWIDEQIRKDDCFNG